MKKLSAGQLTGNMARRFWLESPWVKKFDYCFISHEIGVMKPAEEAFLHVVKKVGKKAEEFLFFDDNQECIDTALKVGMSAFCVSGVTGVESAFKIMGFP